MRAFVGYPISKFVTVVLVTGMLVFSGCTSDGFTAGTGDGELSAEVVENTSADVSAASYTDDSVQSSEYLTEVVRKAVNDSEGGGSGSAVVAVPSEDVDSVRESLSELPDNDADLYYNHYVRCENHTVGIQLVILD